MGYAPASQRQHLTKVTGIDGYWSTFEGAEVSADTNKVYDGGSLTPSVLTAPSETDDVKVSRPYKPEEHGNLVADLMRRVGRWRTTVSRQDTDADLIPIGKPLVFADALLTGVKLPDGDASSSDAAMLELTFTVSAIA